MMTLMVY